MASTRKKRAPRAAAGPRTQSALQSHALREAAAALCGPEPGSAQPKRSVKTVRSAQSRAPGRRAPPPKVAKDGPVATIQLQAINDHPQYLIARLPKQRAQGGNSGARKLLEMLANSIENAEPIKASLREYIVPRLREILDGKDANVALGLSQLINHRPQKFDSELVRATFDDLVPLFDGSRDKTINALARYFNVDKSSIRKCLPPVPKPAPAADGLAGSHRHQTAHAGA